MVTSLDLAAVSEVASRVSLRGALLALATPHLLALALLAVAAALICQAL